MMATTVTGGGPSELKRLAVKVRAADPQVKRDLRNGFREIGRSVAGQAQESILSMPSHHDGTLRSEIARTVSVSTRISASGIEVAVVSAGSRMPPGKEELPAYTNREKGWNHPVYGGALSELAAVTARRILGPGKRSEGRGHGRGWTWVHQVGKPGWFDAPIAMAGRDARRACQDVMDATKRRLGG